MNVFEVVGAYQFSEPEETTVNRLWSRHLMLAACRKALLSDQVSSSQFQHLLAAALIPTRPKAATPFCARRFLPQLVLIAELPENVKSNPQTNCTPMENWDEPNWDMFAVTLTLTHWLNCGCWMVSPWCTRSPMSGDLPRHARAEVLVIFSGYRKWRADRKGCWLTSTFDWLNDWRKDVWFVEWLKKRLTEQLNVGISHWKNVWVYEWLWTEGENEWTFSSLGNYFSQPFLLWFSYIYIYIEPNLPWRSSSLSYLSVQVLFPWATSSPSLVSELPFSELLLLWTNLSFAKELFPFRYIFKLSYSELPRLCRISYFRTALPVLLGTSGCIPA